MKQKPVHPAMQPLLEGGVLMIDKPLHWTSFDVVKKLRVITGISKIGHAGTLDPLATGLLIVCTGRFTKKINEYMGMPKEYTGIITLGATTPTFDLESEPQDFKPYAQVGESEMTAAVEKFTGPQMQLPPIFSAIKKDGKPLYLAARKGQEVELEPRPVTIFSLEFTQVSLPEIHFRTTCSTGTYIRSLANDIGTFLDTGGYLSNLRRTKIGDFAVDEAETLESAAARITALKTAV